MSIFPNYRVDVYGSHSTGLCLHWSDIDLVVGPRGSDIEHDAPIGMSEARMKDALRRISESLRSEGSKMWVTSVNYIE
jgi:DNA polymerase sigma